MGALEGRVAIITGAGRGIGREHALLFAAEGAKVVVNDLGGNADGTGGDQTPAEEVVHEIEQMGGEAIANGDNVASWEGGQRMVNSAIEAFGKLDILVNNAGILRDRVLVNMTEEEWDAVIAVHLKGHFVPTRWAAAYWREQVKAGNDHHGECGQHFVDIGFAVESRADELRRGQVGHRDVHADRGEGAVALRREGELHRAGGAHAPHRGDARVGRHHQGSRRRWRVSTSGIRRTSRRSSRTSRPRIARSRARRSSCRAARCASSSRGRWARASSSDDRWTVAGLQSELSKLATPAE